MPKFDNATIVQQMLGARWSALARTGLDLASVERFDAALLRESRVLVPIDVQGLFVPAGNAEPTVRLPLLVSAPEGQPPLLATPYLQDGPPRAPGVHLHWAMPDALLRGSLADRGAGNRLALPALPDRWLVLRLYVPKVTGGATQAAFRGWVIEADRGRVVPLDQWPQGAPAVTSTLTPLVKADLNGSAGGSLNWTGIYDACINRFALHDPLDDLPTTAPRGVEGEQVAYSVMGWWSDPELDALDGAQTTTSLHERLRQLDWALMEDRENNSRWQAERAAEQAKWASLGLYTASRYGTVGQAVQMAQQPRAPGNVLQSLAKQAEKTGLKPQTAAFADSVRGVVQTEPTWPRSTLLHGNLYGVPLRAGQGPDHRPAASALEFAWGEHGGEVAATLVSTGLAPGNATEREAYERIFGAFTAQMMDRVDHADGLIDIEQWQHASAFASRPGGDGGTDRLQEGAESGPLSAGRQARGMARSRAASKQKGDETRVSFAHKKSGLKQADSRDEQRKDMGQWGRSDKERQRSEKTPERQDRSEPQVREVRRSAPRYFVPMEPTIAVRGAGRSLRHGGDGAASQDKKLQCRYPSQVIRGIDQVASGAEVLPSLGSAAVPEEALLLAREALLHNPWLATWVAAAAARRHQLDPGATRKRLVAEAALRYGNGQAVYDGKSGAFSRAVKMAGGRTRSLYDERIADQLRRFSLFIGVDPDPVGITAWSQPWIPMWLEWELALEVDDRLDAWQLGPVDYDPATGAAPTRPTRTIQGRSVLTDGTAKTMASSIQQWLKAEDERDAQNRGEASESAEAALARIAAAVEQLDVVSTTLDGVREQLLGLAYNGGVARRRDANGQLLPPESNGQAALWMRGGVARLARARLVDAFGRTLDLPLQKLRAPRRVAVTQASRGDGLLVAPRLNLPARLMLRLLDPAVPADGAREANIDQINRNNMVNPVMGFVVPDHIDESLEFFSTAGEPLGQLTHEPLSGGVVWERAPGSAGPADAGPLFGLAPAQIGLGQLAAGAVTSDAQARALDTPPTESALSALLRAIDTTLWSVDALAAMGTEYIAGLVGRPIAVVRARLWLDMQGDFGLDRTVAMTALADREFKVRLGEITRSDDALLAYVVNDDYSRVHVVDKVVAHQALDGGRHRGQLAGLDHATDVPGPRPIEHPYIVAEDELPLRLGQAVTLTLLMHPLGKAHATCGVLPRKSIQLAKDWVSPGLSVMAPSARVGPVLIDPGQVRLPKISAFPKDQLFTRRDSPGTWKDDPILAATQEALLPDLPHEVQEGYIRIAPATTVEAPKG
jgi:hypothetical protein